MEARDDFYKWKRKYKMDCEKYLDNNLSTEIDLTFNKNLKILKESLHFWNTKKIENHTFCLMPNHVHWLFSTFERNQTANKELVYLSRILQSVKRFSAVQINKSLKREGQFWMSESFDTTIRDDHHFWNVANYIINNPVKAKLIQNWQEWGGTWLPMI